MRNQGLTPDSDVQSLQSFGDAGLAVSAPSVGAGVAAATQASLTSADTPEAYKAATYDATQAEKLGFNFIDLFKSFASLSSFSSLSFRPTVPLSNNSVDIILG